MFDGWREDDLVLEETDLELDSTNKFLENWTSLDQVDSQNYQHLESINSAEYNKVPNKPEKNWPGLDLKVASMASLLARGILALT